MIILGNALEESISYFTVCSAESHLNTAILHFYAQQIILRLKNEQFAESKLQRMKANPTK